VGAAAALGGAGLVASAPGAYAGAHAGSAHAAKATVSNPAPISYSCHTQLGDFTIANTFTVPAAVKSGAGAPDIAITDALTFGEAGAGILGQLLNQGGLSIVGGEVSGGFGLYGSAYQATFTVPPLSLTGLTGTGLTGSLTLDGTLTAPASGAGTEQLTAPTILDLAVKQGPVVDPLLVACTIDDVSAAPIGTLTLSEKHHPAARHHRG
jgi:hypothetical protein